MKWFFRSFIVWVLPTVAWAGDGFHNITYTRHGMDGATQLEMGADGNMQYVGHLFGENVPQNAMLASEDMIMLRKDIENIPSEQFGHEYHKSEPGMQDGGMAVLEVDGKKISCSSACPTETSKVMFTLRDILTKYFLH